MGRRSFVVLLSAASLCGCIEANPRYCDETKPCVDPRRPVCDLEGELEESGYTPHLCVAAVERPGGGRDGGVDFARAPEAAVVEAKSVEATSAEATSAEATVPGDVFTASASLIAEPQRLDFGAVVVGGATAGETLRVVNGGPHATGELRMDVQGVADFKVAITDCVATLKPLQHCRVNVSYTPSDTGPASAVLRVLADPGGSLLVVLGGSGRHCGDGQRDSGEACDGSDLGGQTCITLGFDGGNLGCDSDCNPDPRSCTRCGDGVIEIGEECEGQGLNADFGGRRCRDFVYRGSGDLSCSHCQVDSAGCQSEPY